MKNKILFRNAIILILLVFAITITVSLLNSYTSNQYKDKYHKQILIENVPILIDKFDIVYSEESKIFIGGESTLFYIIEYKDNITFETQLELLKASELYGFTDGYLNNQLKTSFSNLLQNSYFNEITSCECYKILYKISYSSMYYEYIYVLENNRFAILIEKAG